MPELPEMETCRSLLLPRIHNRPIVQVEVNRERTINMPPPLFIDRVRGRRIVSIHRRAKHLLFELDDKSVLLLHLMLGGRMYYGTPAEAPDEDAQVVFSFGPSDLYFLGLRLGYLHLYTPEEVLKKLRKLGPEPLDPLFTRTQFSSRIAQKRGSLKPTLTDQSVLAGIGNRYADELCFEAGVLPTRRISDLRESEIHRLYGTMREVLREAIQYGGYMANPLFQGDTLTGGYNGRFRVYNRGGEPCRKCGHPIVHAELANRKVFYCTNCQH